MSEWFQRARALLPAVRPYPSSMREIPYDPPGMIRRRGFFPGGNGCIGDVPADPPSIMIVGNDFGRVSDYEYAAQCGEEDLAGTWSGILELLGRAGVNPDDCFFTNAIMGARNASTNDEVTGPSPGLKDAGFVARCAAYLREQMAIIRPRGVVMLGKNQSRVFAAAFPALAGLRRCSTWRNIDDAGLQWCDDLLPDADFRSRYCAIMHACMRASNMAQHGRHFRDARNDDAELALLRMVAHHVS